MEGKKVMKKKLSVLFISIIFAMVTILPVAYLNNAFAASSTTPTKVTMSSVTANAYNKTTIKWKAASNVTSYNIYYKEAGASKWTKIANVSKSKTSYVHTSSTAYPLKAGKTYYYTVRGYNSTSKKSGSYNKTGIKVVVPSKPSKVTLSSISSSAYNKATIKWKSASNATHYRIYYKESGASKWTKVATVSSSKTSYTHTSSTKYPLTAGKTYYYTVRAYSSKAAALGSYNTTGLKVTIAGKPGKVTLSSVTATAYNKTTVKWNTVSNATEYRVYYKVSGASSWTKIASVSSSKTSYTHTSSSSYPLTPGSKYEYTVRAYNKTAGVFGSYATSKTITVPGKPSKVTLSSVTASDASNVKITWKAATESTHYRIYYKESGTSKWTKIATVKSSQTSYTHTSSTSYPLTAGKTYYYTVRGYNSTSKTLGSYDTTGKSVTIPGGQIPTKVTLKSVKAIYEDTVQINWNVAENATHYYVYYKASGSSNWTKIATVDSSTTSYTHASTSSYPLDAGKTYYFTVRAYNATSDTLGSYDTTGLSVTMPKEEKVETTVKMYTAAEIQAMIDEVFRLTNEARVEYGLPAFTYLEDVQKAAMIRAQEITVLFSHVRPNGENGSTVASEVGIRGIAGENIAAGQTSAKQVITDWMNSGGHRAAILDNDYVGIGIGLYQDSTGRLYWVQNFTNTLDIHKQGTTTFDANGGVFSDGSSKLTYTTIFGKTLLLTDVPTPTREGYTFVGWIDEYNCQKIEFINIGIEGSTALTAKWKSNN